MNNSATMSVHHHTINDILTITGQQYQTEGLYVFVKKKADIRANIQYPYRSDHFFIFIVNCGVMSLKQNLLEYNLKKNDLIVIAPNSIRQFIRTEEDCTISGLAFTSDFMIKSGINKKYIEPFDFFAVRGNPHLHLNIKDATTINDVLKILLQKNLSRDSNPFGLEIIQHYYAAFMYELAALHRRYNADIKIKLTRKEDLTMRFLKLLPEHFKEERSVQYYADQLFVTPKYLTKAVKEITSKTTGTFIDEMVMMEAKVLLSDQSLSVAQVAESLFFSDQFFFSKFFKNHMGIAPSEYRKAL